MTTVPRAGTPSGTPYRTLLTGIPLTMCLETFYDHLRVWTLTDALHEDTDILYNALLLSTSPQVSAHMTAALSTGTSSSFPPAATAVNVGAAVVDFVSKEAADRAMRAAPKLLATSEVTWHHVGSVIAAEGSTAAGRRTAAREARVEGRRAYATTAKHVKKAIQARYAGRRSHPPAAIFLPSPQSRDLERPFVGGALPTQSSATDEVTISLTASNPSHGIPTTCATTGDTFDAFSQALRRQGLGPLHGMQCLAPQEVHLLVNWHTAAALHQVGELTTTTADSPIRWIIHHEPRPIVPLEEALSVGNLQLSSKADVLSAVAGMMARTSGRYGALRDAYGNLLLLPAVTSAPASGVGIACLPHAREADEGALREV